MKKTVMIGIALACLMAGPAAFAAGSGTQGAGMQNEHKAMAKKAMKKKSMKKSHHRMSMADRKAIQQALNTHGAKLKVDGKLGKDSREAIKGYQKANGLKVTGYANKMTREKLGLKF